MSTNDEAPAGGNGGGQVETSSAIGPDNRTPPAPRKPLSNHEYLLAEMRLARTWADIWRNQIDTVGLALKSRWITPEKAVEELSNCPFFAPLVDGGGK